MLERAAFIVNVVDTGRKLNARKTIRRRLLNVLCTFNLRPVSAGKDNATVTKLISGNFVTLQNTLLSLMIKSSLDSLLVKVTICERPTICNLTPEYRNRFLMTLNATKWETERSASNLGALITEMDWAPFKCILWKPIKSTWK